MDEFSAQLSKRLAQPLPGLSAQLQMASGVRKEASRRLFDTSNARVSAVLVALYPHNGIIKTVLMKRPDYDGTHSGQVSFPGGRREEVDNDIVETALREADEEVNIKSHEVTIVGRLTELYIPPSNFMVHPIVGVLHKMPNLIPDQHEVESILLPELDYLFREDIIREKEMVVKKGFNITTPCFEVEGHTVWGATAMIISELKILLAGIDTKVSS